MKKYIIPVAAFIAGMAIVPSVFASDLGSTHITTGQELYNCLTNADEKVCTYEGNKDLSFQDGTFNIAGEKTLNLGGYTATFPTYESANGKEGFNVGEGDTLTIVDGRIKFERTSNTAIKVTAGGNLTIAEDVTVEGTAPVQAEAFGKIVVNGKLDGGASTTALQVKGGKAGNASVVEVNGELVSNGASVYAYSQEGENIAATIKGSVSNELGTAMLVKGKSTLNFNGAHVESTDGNAILLGSDLKLTIDGCSEIVARKAGAALYVGGTANVDTLTIINSTLKSAEGNTIDAGGTSKIQTVVINDSRFEAGKDKNVKAGATDFVNATYNGTKLGEKESVLADAKGSYGTLAAACGGTTADEGEDNGEEAENPNTADTIATYLTIATVALLGLGATAFVAKKSNR